MRKDLFQAVALGFPQGEESAPSVVAKGEFDMAAHMVAVATKHGIPIVERAELCEALQEVEIDQSIPQQLFEVAAALLVEIGILQRRQESV